MLLNPKGWILTMSHKLGFNEGGYYMTGFDLFTAELLQYLIKAVVLLAVIVAAVFTGVGIRKAVNKKKEKQDTGSEK